MHTTPFAHDTHSTPRTKRTTARSSQVNGVLKHAVIRRVIVGIRARDRVPAGVTKRARASGHRQLALRVGELVPADDADGAAVELSGLEEEVEVHGEGLDLEVGRGGGPLRPGHFRRVYLRRRRDSVVEHVYPAEHRG